MGGGRGVDGGLGVVTFVTTCTMILQGLPFYFDLSSII
jgi:hypothetical protein